MTAVHLIAQGGKAAVSGRDELVIDDASRRWAEPRRGMASLGRILILVPGAAVGIRGVDVACKIEGTRPSPSARHREVRAVGTAGVQGEDLLPCQVLRPETCKRLCANAAFKEIVSQESARAHAAVGPDAELVSGQPNRCVSSPAPHWSERSGDRPMAAIICQASAAIDGGMRSEEFSSALPTPCPRA